VRDARRVTTGADDERAALEARAAAYRARFRRSQQRFLLWMVPVWLALAAFWWLSSEKGSTSRWLAAALAVGQLIYGVVLWRALRRPLPPEPGTREVPGQPTEES
jgi:hypothetical protein